MLTPKHWRTHKKRTQVNPAVAALKCSAWIKKESTKFASFHSPPFPTTTENTSCPEKATNIRPKNCCSKSRLARQKTANLKSPTSTSVISKTFSLLWKEPILSTSSFRLHVKNIRTMKNSAKQSGQTVSRPPVLRWPSLRHQALHVCP